MRVSSELEQMDVKDRVIVFIPYSLSESMDRCRGDLSRSDFIELCMRSLLERGEETNGQRREGLSAPATGGAVTRQEFEEFVQHIKAVQRILVDLFMEYGLVSLDQAPADRQEQFKADVARILAS